MENQRKKDNATAKQRDRVIVKTSLIGILTNLLLVAAKAAIGLLANSIAVILDAVNNLSDALSSAVTIAGAKLAGKAPDKKHPLGYGRIEYISAMIVSAIVLYAGITALVESIKKIIYPEKSEYTAVSLVVIALAVAVKLILGLYVKKRGRAISSGALVASGSDAMFDAVLSFSVLLCAAIDLLWGVSLEAYVGALISVFIIRAGVGMLIETMTDILGKRTDPDMAREIKAILAAEPEIRGAYDLILYNYGPNHNYGSVHIELPDAMTVEEVDRLTRKAEKAVYEKTGVILTGVGVYSYNTGDNEAARMRDAVEKCVLAHDWALQMHGFYVDTDARTMRFDVVIDFRADRARVLRELYEEIAALYPDYTPFIVPDTDVSD